MQFKNRLLLQNAFLQCITIVSFQAVRCYCGTAGSHLSAFPALTPYIRASLSLQQWRTGLCLLCRRNFEPANFARLMAGPQKVGRARNEKVGRRRRVCGAVRTAFSSLVLLVSVSCSEHLTAVSNAVQLRKKHGFCRHSSLLVYSSQLYNSFNC